MNHGITPINFNFAELAEQPQTLLGKRPHRDSQDSLYNLEVIQQPQISTTCNCKKSQCLKLYCECFANGGVCGPCCQCNGCYNDELHENERRLARRQICLRNPFAFKPADHVLSLQVLQSAKLADQDRSGHRGCNCRKSNCQKKYCECFQAGVACGAHCNCCDCKNDEDTRAAHMVVFRVERPLQSLKSPERAAF